MKIAVLNGSPKGNISVTMQYVHFIQKKFPQHELKIFNISQEIRKIERDEKAFQGIIDEVRLSDGVLWAFPLYYLHVPSQYKRFIELISERGVQDAFKGKYAASLSTSINFYDHTAHNYMNAICDDLDMRYVDSFSPHMYDLLKEEGRAKLLLFAKHFLEAIENNVPTSKNFKPVTHTEFDYVPGDVDKKIDIGEKKAVIVTDSEDDQTNLGRMIERFRASFSREVEVINLHDVDIKGGCLGCLQCAYDNECSYGDKDEYMEFYKTKVRTADVLVFAGTIQDRYLSSRWKMYFDRSFFNGHIPTLAGKQIGFIVSGPLSQIPNLRQIFEAYVEIQGANLVDFVTDESENSSEIDALVHSLAERLIRFAYESYIRPATFLAVGGMILFRDAIWGPLRFPFQADHKFYRRHRLYDFPQKHYRTRITNGILMLLTKIPSMRREIYLKRMKAELIKPFEKLIEKE